MLCMFLLINTHPHIHTYVYEFYISIFKTEKLNILHKGKSSSYESSLIFIKPFLYLTDSPQFIALICFLISLQSFL